MPHKRAKFAQRVALRSGTSDAAPRGGTDSIKDLPKGAMRIIAAAKVQSEFRQTREPSIVRRGGEDLGPKQRGQLDVKLKGKGKAKAAAANAEEPLKIRPGEKLGDFNRRVEMAMAPGVAAVVRAEASAGRKRKRAADTAKADATPAGKQRKKDELDKAELAAQREALQAKGGGDLDWAAATQRRRLNDVALAPPTFTTAPRGQSKDALKRKAELATALGKTTPAKSFSRLPEPIAKGGVKGLKEQEDLRLERERVIKEYRKLKFGREERGV